MYETKKILITVKTYPTISNKYVELVCTAGITDAGEWIRIYPVQFRELDYSKRYVKYQWITAKVEKNTSDFRPESYRIDQDSIIMGEKIDTNKNWEKRNYLILENGPRVYDSLAEIISNAKNKDLHTSLVTFKPTKLLDFSFSIKHENPNKQEKVRITNQIMQEPTLFGEKDSIEHNLRVLEEIPYTFRYKFADVNGTESNLMVSDWEICELYRNCKARGCSNEEAAKKVKQKYWDAFAEKKDIHFFLGTTKAHHNQSRNPFIIIGVYYPPKIESQQLSLFS